MVKPLHIGNRQFASNLIQGPLAGVSSAPFRRLVWRYSQPAFTYTEMISCKTLLNMSIKSRQRFITRAPDEGTLCFQLSANDANELAEATKLVTDLGADLVDLNCGCPKKKIRTKHAGSKHLSDPSRLAQFIKAMKDNTTIPVSVKIRVDGDSDDNFNRDIGMVIQDAGADVLVVHGRNWRDDYDKPVFYDQIRYFTETLSIPVIGNGDVACHDSLQAMLATGCAGAMICRAGVGQPWLIGALSAHLTDVPFTKPVPSAIGALFVEHVAGLADLLASEKFALIQARKFAKYYGREIPERRNFCEAVNNCETLSDLAYQCRRFFV
ncbi:MAG: nitrogen regulation protein [Legionellales bacterium]|nr:nitrogen regulation protein [Legionellales bacterium]|tara:strand:+ start:5193 stop:6164 length:972 start_codon:yes stop_codon:yes gene_type:complete